MERRSLTGAARFHVVMTGLAMLALPALLWEGGRTLVRATRGSGTSRPDRPVDERDPSAVAPRSSAVHSSDVPRASGLDTASHSAAG